MEKEKTGQSIQFHYRPYEFDKGNYCIEKEDKNGIMRRYMRGVSSGPKWDEHGERMTQKCIKSMMDQANSGDVLLFPDVHGIKESQDIGILQKAEVLPDGDWFTEYRLYDKSDDIGVTKLETINTLWKQSNGLPPYNKPRQKGFSVEGLIPDGGILEAQKDEAGMLSNRVIDQINLGGTILVPKPAYKDSIAHPVFKALGILPPWKKEKVLKTIQTELRQKLNEEQLRDQYYKKKWDISDALEGLLEKIMKKNEPDKREQVELAFDEYKTLMIDLLMQSESLFVDEDEDDETVSAYGSPAQVSKSEIYKSLLANFNKLETAISKKIKEATLETKSK